MLVKNTDLASGVYAITVNLADKTGGRLMKDFKLVA